GASYERLRADAGDPSGGEDAREAGPAPGPAQPARGRRRTPSTLLVLPAVLLSALAGMSGHSRQQRTIAEDRLQGTWEAIRRRIEAATALSEADLGDDGRRWELARSYYRLGLSASREGRAAEAG